MTNMLQGYFWTMMCYATVIFFIDMFLFKSYIAKKVFGSLGKLLGLIPGLLFKGMAQGFKAAFLKENKTTGKGENCEDEEEQGHKKSGGSHIHIHLHGAKGAKYDDPDDKDNEE